jgi:hypothetical protein
MKSGVVGKSNWLDEQSCTVSEWLVWKTWCCQVGTAFCITLVEILSMDRLGEITNIQNFG